MKILCIPIIFIANSIFAQIPIIEWQHCYGGSNYDDCHELVVDTDESFFLLGVTSSPNDGDVSGYHQGTCWFGNCFDYWVVKIDTEGNKIWQQTLGGSNDEFLISGLEIDSGKIILNGWSLSIDGDVTGNHGSADTWIAKLDTSGSIESQICYGGSGFESAPRAAYGHRNNGHIFCGNTDSNNGNVTGNHGLQDVWLFKTDSTDNISWQKCIGGSLDDYAFSFLQTFDMGYLIVGSVNSVDGDITTVSHGGNLGYDYWLCRIDSAGNILWQKNYGGSGDDEARGCIRTLDGGFIIAGQTSSNDDDIAGGNHSLPGGTDFWVIKVDSAGTLLWQRCYGGSRRDDAFGIDSTSDGGFVICGITSSYDGDVTSYVDTFSMNAWIVKFDSQGNIEWNRSVGGSGTDLAESITSRSDGGYIFVGTTDSNDGDVQGQHGATDFWAVKLSSPYVGIAAPANPITDFTTYITNSILFLNFYVNGSERLLAGKVGTEVQLLDITGRLLLSLPLSITEGYNKQQVHAGELGAGVYLVRLMSEGGGVTKKLMVQ